MRLAQVSLSKTMTTDKSRGGGSAINMFFMTEASDK